MSPCPLCARFRDANSRTYKISSHAFENEKETMINGRAWARIRISLNWCAHRPDKMFCSACVCRSSSLILCVCAERATHQSLPENIKKQSNGCYFCVARIFTAARSLFSCVLTNRFRINTRWWGCKSSFTCATLRCFCVWRRVGVQQTSIVYHQFASFWKMFAQFIKLSPLKILHFYSHMIILCNGIFCWQL